MRRASLASMIRTAQAAGLTVREIVQEGDNYRLILTTTAQEPLSELERAREARRARKALRASYGDQEAS